MLPVRTSNDTVTGLNWSPGTDKMDTYRTPARFPGFEWVLYQEHTFTDKRQNTRNRGQNRFLSLHPWAASWTDKVLTKNQFSMEFSDEIFRSALVDIQPTFKCPVEWIHVIPPPRLDWMKMDRLRECWTLKISNRRPGGCQVWQDGVIHCSCHGNLGGRQRRWCWPRRHAHTTNFYNAAISRFPIFCSPYFFQWRNEPKTTKILIQKWMNREIAAGW